MDEEFAPNSYAVYPEYLVPDAAFAEYPFTDDDMLHLLKSLLLLLPTTSSSFCITLLSVPILLLYDES